MKKILLGCGAIVVAVLVLGGFVASWLISNSNNMVRLGNVVEEKWGAVQSDLQSRLDKVNQLVPTVQGAASQELAVFAELAEQAQGLSKLLVVDEKGNPVPPSPALAQQIQDQAALVSQAVVNVKSYVADNPEIGSTALFSNLMVQIEGAENRINVSRKDYNAAVTDYQDAVETFPGSFIGSVSGHHADDYGFFNASPAAQNAPTIQFGTPAPR